MKREAARYGVMPLSSEIVGLIPKKALEDAAEWFLQVENFDSSLILENRLAAVMAARRRSADCARALSRLSNSSRLRRPRRVAARGGRAERWRPDWADGGGDVAREESLLAVRSAIERRDRPVGDLREEFKAAIDADTLAYEAVMKAFKKAKTDPSAQGEVEGALKQATNVPLGVAQNAQATIAVLESLRPITNPKMASDLTTGIALARAAKEGGLANVEINLADMEDTQFVNWVREKVAAL